ncbi:beta-lactamase class A [Streptacidiphilus sp. MAP12-33]|uniref:serine hydrolase n=1 Tax=Streptacidiphilus sp. MAP12-33 TaxID=3156266 RepID=UPI003515CFED
MLQTGARRAFLVLVGLLATVTVGVLVTRSAFAHGPARTASAGVSPGRTSPPSSPPSSPVTVPATASPSLSPTRASVPTPSPTPSRTDTDVAQNLDSALAAAAGHAAVSVADLGTGATLSRGDTGHLFVTASIVKADILAALLLRCQDEGSVLTADQRELATLMIEQSDNDAATSLLEELGGAGALDAANARLGLHRTTAGTGGYWGLTTTTSADQLALLRQIFGSGASSRLSTASRNYVRSLMGDVEADQDWGVSAAAGAGDDYALKNGWLPRSATGLWVVNSIGEVDRDGHTYLVAVLSDGNPSMADGISLVESVAEAAVQELAGGAG